MASIDGHAEVINALDIIFHQHLLVAASHARVEHIVNVREELRQVNLGLGDLGVILLAILDFLSCRAPSEASLHHVRCWYTSSIGSRVVGYRDRFRCEDQKLSAPSKCLLYKRGVHHLQEDNFRHLEHLQAHLLLAFSCGG